MLTLIGTGTGETLGSEGAGTGAPGAAGVVVVAMASDKFLGTVHRFDADGENLRYLPVDGTGLACFRRLDEHERNVAGVQRIALPLFLTFDALREAWVQYIQWPHERAAMRASTPKRKAKIADRARQNGLEMEAVTIGSDREWDTLTLARDLEFLFDNSRSRGIIVEAVILPFANPALVDTTWSDSARAKRDLSILRMRTWLEARGVPYVDFNEARHQSHFPEPAWDDVFHLKSPEAYQYMASEIAKAVPPLFVKSCQAGDRHDR